MKVHGFVGDHRLERCEDAGCTVDEHGNADVRAVGLPELRLQRLEPERARQARHAATRSRTAAAATPGSRARARDALAA